MGIYLFYKEKRKNIINKYYTSTLSSKVTELVLEVKLALSLNS